MYTLAVLEVSSEYSPMSALDTFPLQNDIIPKILIFREVPSIINVNFKKSQFGIITTTFEYANSLMYLSK